MRVFIIPISNPSVQKSFKPAKALRETSLKIFQYLSILALLAVATALAVWPPHLWLARADYSLACVVSLLAMAALQWVPHAMIGGTYRALGSPIFAKVVRASAFGGAATASAFLVMILGEMRYPPMQVCLAASFAFLAGNLAIVGSGVVALERLGEVIAPEYRVGPVLGPHLVAMGHAVLTVMLAALTATLEIPALLDWRFIIPLLGVLPIYVAATVWCLRVRGRVRLMSGPEGDWMCVSMVLGVLGASQMSIAFLSFHREAWLIAALMAAGFMMYSLNNALYGWIISPLVKKSMKVLIPEEAGKIVLIEARPAAYTGEILGVVEEALSGPTLVVTRRGSPLASRLKGKPDVRIAYMVLSGVSHPRQIDGSGKEFEVGPSSSQIIALIRKVASELEGSKLTVFLDAFPELSSRLGPKDAYIFIRALSDAVLSMGGRMIILNFPDMMSPREASALRVLATEIVVL